MTRAGERIRRNLQIIPLAPACISLPLVLMSLPLGLPNALTQLLTIILLIPLLVAIWRTTLFNHLFLLIFLGTVFVSLLQITINPAYESSIYQAFRASLPFFFICAIIVNYRGILIRLSMYLSSDSVNRRKFINLSMNAFAIFASIQTVSFLFGFSMANTLSSSEDNRVMIFQTTSCILLFYFAILQRKYIMIMCLSVVIVGSGSKAIFVAALGAAGVALVRRFDFAMVVRFVVAGGILGGALVYVNPLVIDRLSSFIENDDGEAFKDVTREFEIEQAKNTFLRSPLNTALGAGFAMQLSPGVPTFDPAWAENSKYDIENGYWGGIAKLGIVFSALFVLLCLLNIPWTSTSLVILCIEGVMFFKTSYQIFCYMDGVCILLWGLLVELSLKQESSKSPKEIKRIYRSIAPQRISFNFSMQRSAGASIATFAISAAAVLTCCGVLIGAPRPALSQVLDGQASWSLIRATDAIDWWDAPGANLLLESTEPPKRDQGPSLLPRSIGWREYRVEIERSGWFRLAIPGFRRSKEVGVAVDSIRGKSTASVVNEKFLDLEQWFWLDAGKHRVRFVQKYWTPTAQGHLAAARLQVLMPRAGAIFRLMNPSTGPSVYRLGSCLPYVLQVGGNGFAFPILVTIRRGASVVTKLRIDVPASGRPSKVNVSVPCDIPGDYNVEFRPENRDLSKVSVSRDYAVFDTTRQQPVIRAGALVEKLDVVHRRPDYGSATSSIVFAPEGSYRESGPIGMPGKGKPPLDWFGYRISGLTAGHGYVLEIDYPDDAPRAFVVALRDVAENGYPPSVGINTGGLWPLSGRTRTASVPFWPKSDEARLLVFNYFGGLRAAVSSIRIHQMNEEREATVVSTERGRSVAFWYEEGERFRDLVGDNSPPHRLHAAVDRYLRLLASSWVDTLFQSAAVYGYQLFPSAYGENVVDDQSTLSDALLLGAERYGVQVALELHPRADLLLWGAAPGDLKRRLLLSTMGKTSIVSEKGTLNRPPLFNLLDPEVRSWYLAYISEVASTYADRSAFMGVQARMSYWRNSALNNFGSLSWGYNAAITEKFFADTGLAPLADVNRHSDDPVEIQRRASDILGRYREQWIRWRCDQVANLMEEVVVAIRRARPDLVLSLNVFGLNGVSNVIGPDRLPPGTSTAAEIERLREAGVDILKLGSIEGVRVIDERWSHGPRNAAQAIEGPDLRADPEMLYSPKALTGPHGAVLWPMVYFEIRSDLWPGEAIGMPEKRVSPWISAPMEAAGRNRLARYAALLANSDPILIGDGGNNFAVIDGGLSDFMREFRLIPARPFSRLASTPKSLSVRCSEQICYFVSLVPDAQRVTIHIEAAKEIRRMLNGQEVPLKEGIGSFRLDGFELKVFSITGDSSKSTPRIEAVSIQ